MSERDVCASLGEVANEPIEQSGPPASGDFIYVDIGSVDKESKAITDAKVIPVTDAPSRARQRLRKGDVLVSMTRPNLNAVAIVPSQFDGAIGSTGFHVLRTRWMEPRFLHYLVQTSEFVESMTGVVQGALYPAVRPADVNRFEFRLPPRVEQTRIVEKLEELLSDLDAGVAELKAAQRKLAQYRQSLLKAAVEGALTQGWRARNAPRETGAELLQRILRERRTRWEQKQLAKFAEQGKTPPKDWRDKYPEPVAPDTAGLPELPQGWVWASLDQLGEVVTGFTPAKANPNYFGGEIPFFKPTDLDAGYWVRDYRESLTPLGAQQGRLLPPNSVLVTCIGATIGKTGLARMSCATNQQINAVAPTEDGARPEFIFFVLSSGFGQHQITSNASATTLPILNKSKFERLPIPLPGGAEQAAAVEELEKLMASIDEHERAVEIALLQAAAQRKNLLRAAFAGQLVPQDPRDEPASELLARIRAARAASGAATPTRKRGRKAKENA